MKYSKLVNCMVSSAVPARLGLKAAALASSIHGPSQSRQPGLGLGLAWLRLRLLYAKYVIFCLQSIVYPQHVGH